ncbi:MAG: uncharacterized protein QOK26_760, partial [Pseudonocardiales bacterium]|nr:uncharacterized protein [Pseudonocardiales bacterium]
WTWVMTEAVTSTPVATHAASASPAPSAADCHETHIGVVFLVGDRAYKLKKPVLTGFLDFTTRTARLAACRREVALNRRLCPDVYLGVSDVTDPVTGELADHLVVMRRMPADRSLSALVTAGVPVEDPLRALARQLAAFHARAERGPRIAQAGSVDALRGRWVGTFASIERFTGVVLSRSTVEAVERLSMRFLDGRRALFDARCDQGRIVDGHGDLIADDVFCLPDGPRALDCLEFSDDLRFVDGLDDAAFLAMDLERLGRPDLAQRFFHDYAEFAADPAPASLRHHYVAYRSWVRALVACVRAGQGEQSAQVRAERHADITLRHLRTAAVRLVLVGGLPGTGKSTLAGALADRMGAVLLSSDRLRKQQAGLEPESSATADYRHGIYAPAATEMAYSELLRRAEVALGAGEHVVVDASWTDRRYRDQAVELAAQTHAELVQLRCDAPISVTTDRILHRGASPSDATIAVASAMAATADPWPAATTIRTTNTAAESLAPAVRSWDDATNP